LRGGVETKKVGTQVRSAELLEERGAIELLSESRYLRTLVLTPSDQDFRLSKESIISILSRNPILSYLRISDSASDLPLSTLMVDPEFKNEVNRHPKLKYLVLDSSESFSEDAIMSLKCLVCCKLSLA